MRRGTRKLLAMVTAVCLARTAAAHHSFALFDFEKSVTLSGTVKAFQWANPHVFIDLLVPTASGAELWSVELTSPSHLVRNGWKPGTVKAGEPLTIVVHPLRDGRRGGNYVSGKHADGRALGVAP